MNFIRFRSNPNISLAFRFEPYKPAESDLPTIKFTIATASPILGYDENGKIQEDEKFIFIDDNGQQVEEFDDATILAEGSIFPSLYPEIEKSDINFFISFYSTIAMFKNEFESFVHLITGDYFSTIYKEYNEGKVEIL